MRSQLRNRVTSGVVAALLLLTNVLLPASPAFASTGEGGGSPVTTSGTNLPVWCMATGNGWKAVLGDEDSGVNKNRYPLNELPVGHSEEVYIGDDGQAYSHDRSDQALKRELAGDCAAQYTEVAVPDMPAVTCIDGQVSWALPEDTDLFHWNLVDNRHITVTIAIDGVVFEGTNINTHRYILGSVDEYTCPVDIPSELPLNDVCAVGASDVAGYDISQLKSIEHTDYVVNADRSVTVTADTGYTLNVNGVVVGSTYTYVAPAEMLCNATSAEPEFVDNCGVLNDYYIVKDTDHVAYYNGQTKLVAGEENYVTDASKVTVDAQVTDENYVLVGDAPYEFQFTNERCAPSVELDVNAKCKGTDTKIIANVENTTDSEQAYLVMVRDASGVLKKRVVVVAAHDSTRTTFKVDGDGSFTVKIFAYDQATHTRGDLLAKKHVNTECTVVYEDTFTPEIYKINQDGQILSTGTFDIEVCQPRLALMQTEGPNGCTTYEDVMLGTDGMWFENNVAYTENVPTTVTITETKAPVGCTAATMPWVFNWNYNYESYQLFNRNNMPSGSWDTADHSNVFNLTNQCDEGGKGGSGGEETPKPTHKPTVVKTVTPSETLANTGTSTNGILAIAVAMLLASIGFAVSPRLGRTDA